MNVQSSYANEMEGCGKEMGDSLTGVVGDETNADGKSDDFGKDCGVLEVSSALMSGDCGCTCSRFDCTVGCGDRRRARS